MTPMTPIVPLRLMIKRRWHTIQLKLESYNPTGSTKDRVATSLIRSLALAGRLNHSSRVIESSSGNLAVGLAKACMEEGYPFVAVVDPKLSEEHSFALQRYGAEIDRVHELDETRGFLLTRLRRVSELCKISSRFVWPNQYENMANPLAHEQTTGPELFCQMGGHVDAIFVAVSTGGTLVGLRKYFRSVGARTCFAAVDAHGSVALGGESHSRNLTGIGSSIPARFVMPGDYDLLYKVDDADAFTTSRRIRQATGISLGGSSGAIIFACAKFITEHRNLDCRIACLCADGGDNYLSTIYNDAWYTERVSASAKGEDLIEDLGQGD